MKKIYFGDDSDRNSDDKLLVKGNLTLGQLKEFLQTIEVYTSLETRAHDAIVKVHEGMGTSQFLSSGFQDIRQLQFLSHRVEKRGDVTFYYIKTVSD